MSNSSTTKTSNECLVRLKEFEQQSMDILRDGCTRLLNRLYEEGNILPYRYSLMAMDFLSSQTIEEMEVLIREFTIADWEIRRVWLIERQYELMNEIREEVDEVLEAGLWADLHEIQMKLEVLTEQWTMQTKYQAK